MKEQHSNLIPLETEALVERHRQGHRDALEELFRRYAKRVRRIVWVRLGAFSRSRAEVEDVVEEALHRAFDGFGDFASKPDALLIDWMARIAENSMRNLIHYELAYKRNKLTQEFGEQRATSVQSLRSKARLSRIHWDPPSTERAPKQEQSAEEMEEIVDECLIELPEEQREMILLVDYVDGDWGFVLERTGHSNVEAAKRFYRRARVTLAAKVDHRIRA